MVQLVRWVHLMLLLFACAWDTQTAAEVPTRALPGPGCGATLHGWVDEYVLHVQNFGSMGSCTGPAVGSLQFHSPTHSPSPAMEAGYCIGVKCGETCDWTGPISSLASASPSLGADHCIGVRCEASEGTGPTAPLASASPTLGADYCICVRCEGGMFPKSNGPQQG